MRVLLHSKSQIVADIPGFQREPDIERADADLTAEGAGRLCYLSWGRPNPKTANNLDYLLNIQNERHYSVLGHASASFYFDGISRNCTHEMIRHRWFTFSEVSQRYVDISDFEFVEHPGLEELAAPGTYIYNNFEVERSRYQETVAELVRRGHTRKEARQAARHVLAGGVETKILMSGNLRAWRDFLAQRLTPYADKEIRNLALEVFGILKGEFPGSFQDFDSQGMITVERLIKRAMDRRDTAEFFSTESRSKSDKEFVDEVRKILDVGLWVLKYDPWLEEEVGSNI